MNQQHKENAFEIFLADFDNCSEFREFVVDAYFTDQELWEEKEYGRSFESALIRVFEFLLEADEKAMLWDPCAWALQYPKRKKEVA